jgi:hypothetical protein
LENLKSCVFIFRLEVCSEHVLEHVRFPEVLTGPDESDLALSEVRCIVSSERVLGFRPADLSEHARLLRDAWTDYQVTCGFLPPHLQAAMFTLFRRLHRRQSRSVMVGEDEDGVLPEEADDIERSPVLSSISDTSSCEMIACDRRPRWTHLQSSSRNDAVDAIDDSRYLVISS